MAEPFLVCPADWHHTNLEAKPDGQFIVRVESGGTPSTTIDEYWDGDIPWLTPKEITGLAQGLFVSHTERFITSQGLRQSAAKLFPAGTVMLSKRAPVGSVAINAVPMATNQGFLNFRCGELLRPVFLAFWFRANKLYLDKIANGSTYPELYLSDLFEIEISIPPLDVQDRIIEVLSALQFASLLGPSLEQSSISPDAVVALQAEDRKLMRIRESLMPALLSGRLDLSKVGS
jgi:restriction endonuclease S subunit